MDHQLRSSLKKSTLKLMELNEQAKSFYLEQARKEGYVPDFYGKVKPFADQVQNVYEKWRPLVLTFIASEKPAHLHPILVERLKDNLDAVAIQSFYGNTSYKVLMSTYQSVQYTLKQVLRALDQK